MSQTPKDRQSETHEPNDTVAEDQRSHGYYYDDAYGYEEYRPEDDEDEECEDDGSNVV